jgi:hypothetical protein
MPLMAMHMLPPPEMMEKARAGANVEQRIDALIELRARGTISDAEVEQALDSIVSQMLLAVFPVNSPPRGAQLVDDSLTHAGGQPPRTVVASDPEEQRRQQRTATTNRLHPYFLAILRELEI